jgi:hypothetical protein
MATDALPIRDPTRFAKTVPVSSGPCRSAVAELDGDENGYLVGKVAEIERQPR